MPDQRAFEAREVSWTVDGIDVFGTLTQPAGEGPYPGVVIVAGSGPTDRDWCSPLLPGANGSGRLLAEALSGHGFATLRYDKRASGSRVLENLPKMWGKISMQSHIDELSGAVEALASATGVDPDDLFALTSSEGAIHAINYQLQGKGRRFRGLVLTGAPGRPVGELARSQILAQLSLLPEGERDTIVRLYDEGVSAFVEGRDVMPDPSLPEGVRALLLGLANPANLPFARELWSYDLSDSIARVAEPILVVIGKKDIQADWRADGRALEAASRNRDVTFVYPENADHVLKREGRPREALLAEAGRRYNAEGRELDPEALAAILGWLEAHRGRGGLIPEDPNWAQSGSQTLG